MEIYPPTHPVFTGQAFGTGEIILPENFPPVEPDGLYSKYRVIREPENVEEHPVKMDFMYQDEDGATRFAEEVDDFVFVLKPETDFHARVAIAAYAASVSREKPILARDLLEVMSGF